MNHDWSALKMKVYHLFSAVVAVIMMILIEQQFDNSTFLLDAMNGRKQAQEPVLPVSVAEPTYFGGQVVSVCINRKNTARK